MSRPAGDPLTKVTLNIFTADYDWFKRRYGDGYSIVIRELVMRHRRKIQKQETHFDDDE